MPRVRRALVACLALALLAACSQKPSAGEELAADALSPAADLRVRLEGIFREHVYVAARLTEAVVTKQRKLLMGAQASFDDLGIAFGKELGAAHGEAVERGFISRWRLYRQLLVAYTDRLLRKKSAGAITKLLTKTATQLTAFWTRLAPELNPPRTLQQMSALIATVEDVIEAQVKKDYAKADTLTRTASVKAAEVVAPFANALVADRPTFPGNFVAPAAVFRYTLSSLLREQVYFMTQATEDSLSGGSAGAKAATAALAPGVDQLAAHLGSAYGPAFITSFTPLWRRQAELVAAYASAGTNTAKRDAARAALDQYAADLTVFLDGANPSFDRAILSAVLRGFEGKLRAIVDAQVKGDFDAAGTALRVGAVAADAVAATLADGTVRRFPKRFLRTPSSG